MSDLRKPGARPRLRHRVIVLLALTLTPWRHCTAVTARGWAFVLYGFVR